MRMRAAPRSGGFAMIETLVVGNSQVCLADIHYHLPPLIAFSREKKLDGRLNDTHVSYTDRLIAFSKLFDSIIFSFSTWNH